MCSVFSAVDILKSRLNFQLETLIFQDAQSAYLLTPLVASEVKPNH